MLCSQHLASLWRHWIRELCAAVLMGERRHNLMAPLGIVGVIVQPDAVMSVLITRVINKNRQYMNSTFADVTVLTMVHYSWLSFWGKWADLLWENLFLPFNNTDPPISDRECTSHVAVSWYKKIQKYKNIGCFIKYLTTALVYVQYQSRKSWDIFVTQQKVTGRKLRWIFGCTKWCYFPFSTNSQNRIPLTVKTICNLM